MYYWDPTLSEITDFTPSNGWNAIFSEKDKITYTNIYFFLTNKKGYKPQIAEIYTQMILFKQKYPHMKYSDEQEGQLQKALKTVYT